MCSACLLVRHTHTHTHGVTADTHMAACFGPVVNTGLRTCVYGTCMCNHVLSDVWCEGLRGGGMAGDGGTCCVV